MLIANVIKIEKSWLPYDKATNKDTVKFDTIKRAEWKSY